MSEFEDAFNAAGRRSRRGGGHGGGNRHRGGHGGTRGVSTIVMPGACDCSQCQQPGLQAPMAAPPAMTPVAAKMMAEQAAQVAADAAAKAAALNTAAPAPTTPAPTSGIDGFDNFMGKKLTKPQKIGTIIVAVALIGTVAYFTYKRFKKAK